MVIIGAGFAGLTVAQKIEHEFNVLVLEARDAFYFSVGAMRASCDREFTPKILIPYTNALKYGKIAKGACAEGRFYALLSPHHPHSPTSNRPIATAFCMILICVKYSVCVSNSILRSPQTGAKSLESRKFSQFLNTEVFPNALFFNFRI